MSKASALISDSITGEDYKTIHIGGKTYKAYPPNIMNICKAIHAFDTADLENKNFLDVVENFNKVKESILTGISFLMRGTEKDDPNITGIVRGEQHYPSAMENITIDEMSEALKVCFSLIDNSDFNICNFEIERADSSSNVRFVGNKTFLGQIASFIDNLHLRYREVVEVIPYRVLLIMQKDKLHQSYGDKIEYKGARENSKFKDIK